jgi:cysteine synthase
MQDLGIGNTPVKELDRLTRNGRLLLKLETYNSTGSVKDRTAYFLLRNLWLRGCLEAGDGIVESTSGNLGISLATIGMQLGVTVCCVIDPSIAANKKERLIQVGATLCHVDGGCGLDHREPRMRRAEDIGSRPGWVWINQYANPAGMIAHYHSTGREIIELGSRLDAVFVALGTGGTACGIGYALLASGLAVNVIGVEPMGSTILGGCYQPHRGFGAGYLGQSPLMRQYGHVLSGGMKVHEEDAAKVCREVYEESGISVGPTTGLCIYAALRYLDRHRDRTVLCLAADGGGDYETVMI